MLKKVKKLMVIFLASLLMIVSFVGCTKTNQTNNDSSQPVIDSSEELKEPSEELEVTDELNIELDENQEIGGK